MSWKERLRGLHVRIEGRFPVVTELTGRLLSTNLLDGATRLASRAFLASVPLLFAVPPSHPRAYAISCGRRCGPCSA
ncbi:hypothetical protein [Streptomyces sp. H27-H5]|uniref:hypothetical protein n=1 Tax=Streptomyces sp. H27-H5 TaxID=2996460 RepID=UPI00227029E8|nr:hypothetical protein [Streptomyces sp. H27-H5]MCY0955355.1 hypothetical protein [Streptomyces sp. H27-H5]